MINHLVDPTKLSTEVMSQLPLPVLIPNHLNCRDEGDWRPKEEIYLKSNGDWRPDHDDGQFSEQWNC